MIFLTLSIVLFFNHMYLKIVKINRVDKAVLIKSGFAVTFEFRDRGIKPDRFAQVKFVADAV